MRNARGVRKVNEVITQQGRTLILTEEDTSKYDWDSIPDGTLHINPNDGTMSVKLKGASDWVPAGLKNDGTVAIAKDTIMHEETFTIMEIHRDAMNKVSDITYETKTKERRHTAYDKDYGFVFLLEEGRYPQGRACLEVTVDDILRRTEQSGGLKELTETSFALSDELVVGQEITARYYSVIRVGNPYPRFFESAEEPKDAEVGDFWIDYNADPEDAESDLQDEGKRPAIQWADIQGKPTTLAGYGVDESKYALADHRHVPSDVIGGASASGGGASGGNAASVNFYKADGNRPGTLAVLDTAGNVPANHLASHLHSWTDIKDRPAALPADGGNAKAVGGYEVQNNAPNSLAVLDGMGKLPGSNLGAHTHTSADIADMAKAFDALFKPGMIMQWYGEKKNVPDGWVVCDGTNGTPDMRDRFAIGASDTRAKGVYGGTAQHVLRKSELPPLGRGSFSSTSHSQGTYPDGDGVIVRTETRMSVGIAEDTATDSDGRNFIVDLSTGFDNEPIDMMPSYCALYYIMKV